jgi:hypothetical protein
MSANYARPKWWQVYFTVPLLIVLFALDIRLKLSVRGHQVVQIGILILVYGLIHLWIKANAKALSEMDQLRYGGWVRVIKIPPYQLPDMNVENNKRPMLQLPDSELKGMLSDTFEMDYVDAEFLPVEEVTQDLKKEEK